MTKTMHPADIADREMIATAAKFNVHIRRAPGDTSNSDAPNLAAAIRIADNMGKTAGGKSPMIYAITSDNQSIFVPPDVIEAERNNAPIKAGISGKEFSQLAAIIVGGGFKRANSKDAALARFKNAAKEAGIENASELSEGTYADAEAAIRAHMAKDKPAAEPKPAKAPKPATEEKPAKGKRAEILAAAERGELPTAPDFSAATHARFRDKLAEIVALIDAGDIAALKAFPINPISSSPKAMDKYRNLAVIALEARAAKNTA